MFDKIIDYFPGLQDIYHEYKNPGIKPTEQQKVKPVDDNNNKQNNVLYIDNKL